jgi:hypothetical protein
MARYTVYQDNTKLIIHAGTGYYETYPRQSFYRACIDIICTINTQDDCYYYLTSDLKENIKLRK